MSMPVEIPELLAGARRVLLTSHVPPDGDGLGSGIALLRWLRSRGAEAVFAAGGPIQRSLRFLFEEGEVDTSPAGPPGEFDLAIALDSATLVRLREIGDRSTACPAFLNIDHHATNELYGTVNWVDDAAPATGLLVYRLLRELGAPVTKEIAVPLYVAVVTDTGRFGFSNTTPETHRMAADLLEAGIEPSRITDALYRSAEPSFLRLTGLAIEAMELRMDGLLAVICATEEMISGSGAQRLDVGDLVDVPMSLDGVEVGALLRTDDSGGTKVSLRSRRWFPVNRFAARWGGGGHARAAGAVIPEPLESGRATLLAALEEEIERERGARG